MHNGDKIRILTQHRDKLHRLIDLLSDVGLPDMKTKSIEIIVTNADSTSHEVTLDAQELDTGILVRCLTDVAQARSEYLEDRIKELSEYRSIF